MIGSELTSAIYNIRKPFYVEGLHFTRFIYDYLCHFDDYKLL